MTDVSASQRAWAVRRAGAQRVTRRALEARITGVAHVGHRRLNARDPIHPSMRVWDIGRRHPSIHVHVPTNCLSFYPSTHLSLYLAIFHLILLSRSPPPPSASVSLPLYFPLFLSVCTCDTCRPCRPTGLPLLSPPATARALSLTFASAPASASLSISIHLVFGFLSPSLCPFLCLLTHYTSKRTQSKKKIAPSVLRR